MIPFYVSNWQIASPLGELKFVHSWERKKCVFDRGKRLRAKSHVSVLQLKLIIEFMWQDPKFSSNN